MTSHFCGVVITHFINEMVVKIVLQLRQQFNAVWCGVINCVKVSFTFWISASNLFFIMASIMSLMQNILIRYMPTITKALAYKGILNHAELRGMQLLFLQEVRLDVALFERVILLQLLS